MNKLFLISDPCNPFFDYRRICVFITFMSCLCSDNLW